MYDRNIPSAGSQEPAKEPSSPHEANPIVPGKEQASVLGKNRESSSEEIPEISKLLENTDKLASKILQDQHGNLLYDKSKITEFGRGERFFGSFSRSSIDKLHRWYQRANRSYNSISTKFRGESQSSQKENLLTDSDAEAGLLELEDKYIPERTGPWAYFTTVFMPRIRGIPEAFRGDPQKEKAYKRVTGFGHTVASEISTDISQEELLDRCQAVFDEMGFEWQTDPNDQSKKEKTFQLHNKTGENNDMLENILHLTPVSYLNEYLSSEEHLEANLIIDARATEDIASFVDLIDRARDTHKTVTIVSSQGIFTFADHSFIDGVPLGDLSTKLASVLHKKATGNSIQELSETGYQALDMTLQNQTPEQLQNQLHLFNHLENNRDIETDFAVKSKVLSETETADFNQLFIETRAILDSRYKKLKEKHGENYEPVVVKDADLIQLIAGRFMGVDNNRIKQGKLGFNKLIDKQLDQIKTNVTLSEILKAEDPGNLYKSSLESNVQGTIGKAYEVIRYEPVRKALWGVSKYLGVLRESSGQCMTSYMPDKLFRIRGNGSPAGAPWQEAMFNISTSLDDITGEFKSIVITVKQGKGM